MRIEKITLNNYLENKNNLYKQVLELLVDEYVTEENILFAGRVVDNMEKYLKDNSAIIYSLQEEKKINGFIWTYISDDDKGVAHINYFYIQPQYRSQGYGTKLLNKIIDVLKEKNIRRVNLLVKKINISAQRFYIKNGFVVIGEENDKLFLEKVV